MLTAILYTPAKVKVNDLSQQALPVKNEGFCCFSKVLLSTCSRWLRLD